LSGQEIWCPDRDIYLFANHNKGTFSDYYVGLENYLYRIPDSIPSEYAAPLQCAGATVYSALVNNIKPGDRVGIVGLGGLGHLAVQFSSKLGAETVVFSSSRNKEAEAKSFGASEFVLLSEPEKISKPVDVVLVAGSHNPDWPK
jgi:D-arabinose 1-dehydrogenase-like Zn-dependent alcohol dehydrogenase